MKSTQVKELMEKTLIKVSPDDNLFQASKKMKEAGCGCLPVGVRDDIVGVITDRDIVTRAIAEGLDPAEEKVTDYMSKVARMCRDTDTLSDAAKSMREHKVSRLVVMNDSGKACGILTFGKILRTHPDPEEMTEVIALSSGRRDGKESANDVFSENSRYNF